VENEDVVNLLASIDRRLALLSGALERDMRQSLIDTLLRTAARIAMFDGLDGRRGSSELAKAAGIGERAAQLFIKELLELGLVRPAPSGGGRTVVVERDDDAIVRWYLQRTDSSS
jgi:Fic family protein